MELQKEVRMWQRPGSHEYYPYNQNMDNTRNSNQHQMSDQHTGVHVINQQSRIPNQANPPFITPMAPPHYSQIPTEQSRKNPDHIQAPMYHNSRIQAIPADNINQIDKEPTEEARLTINLTNSAAAKNDEVKAHTEVSHQVDVTPRTGLITTASSGDAPLEADCHQKFPLKEGPMLVVLSI
ncbi:Hypothetical predicted protein [Mytilus galloprovincialis]|uniref:Uncharacterized protein n=1 Tax=Mytilus galloprovincialis TaxID=29158 RepID=A0A8B6CWR2_MYTGA|nr:Hypothetical predicted protein [Mytilus galloprovincialis]